MAGEKQALALALESAPPLLEPEPEQVDLLDALGLPKNENVEAIRAARSEKGGRPPGARNKRTVEMADYLLSRYTSPLEVLAQIAASRTDELAASLDCTKLEALQERRLAAIALKDHIHSKMPVAVNVNNRKTINLNIVIGMGEEEAVGDVLDLTAEAIASPPQSEADAAA